MLTLRYCPTTNRLFDVSTGKTVTVSGIPGRTRWREEYHATSRRRVGCQPTDGAMMIGGPWAKCVVRRKFSDRKVNGQKIAGEDLGPLPDIWLSKTFDGFYELMPCGTKYRWVNPLF